jgi:UDP-glucose 4-epimerase
VLRRLGKTAIPLPPGTFMPLQGLLRRLGLPRMDLDTARFLHYGRGVDTTRMREELGFEPSLSSIGAIELVAMALQEARA